MDKKKVTKPTIPFEPLKHDNLKCDGININAKKIVHPAPASAVATSKSKPAKPNFEKLLKETKKDSTKSSEDWQSEYEARKAAINNSNNSSPQLPNDAAELEKQPTRGFSSKPIVGRPPSSALEDKQIEPHSNTKSLGFPKLFENNQLRQNENRQSRQKGPRPLFPEANYGNGYANRNSGRGRWSGVSELKSEGNSEKWNDRREQNSGNFSKWNNGNDSKSGSSPRWAGDGGHPNNKRQNYGDPSAKRWRSDADFQQTKLLPVNNQQGGAQTGPSAFGKKPPPPPGQLAMSGFGQQSGFASGGNASRGVFSNRNSGGGRDYNKRDNQTSPLGRPTCPTPGSYGTSYGGPPTPGPNPSKAFQPPGFVPPTPPAGKLNSGQGFGRGRFNNCESSSGRGGFNNSGPGYGRGNSNNSGSGFRGGWRDNNTSGFRGGGFSNSGPGFRGGGSSNIGSGFGSGGFDNSNGPGSGRGGFNNGAVNNNSNSGPSLNPLPPVKSQSFQQQMKNVKADSKKDANTWQAEYEAKKRARLGDGF